MRTLKIICVAMAVCLLAYGAVYARDDEQQDEDQAAIGATPPRLSLVDGQVSFWRSGAEDWAQAQVNTALAPGDQLYAGSPGNLELQIDTQSFFRAGEGTQVGLENLEADLIQFKVTEGHVSVDIHQDSDSGQAVEIDTPNATFLIENPGYYKVHVSGDSTTLSVHWSGQATVTPAEGAAFVVSSDREVRLRGVTRPEISTYRASELDQWDQWCLSRSDENLHSASSRYLSPDIYGASDLDRAGVWRDTPEYGPVWAPTHTPEGWAPFTSGSWTNDPVYGWTWVDNEPWGWAPYHYGRWISLNGRWVWAPGPPVRRPAYAPALVAFFGGQDNSGGGPAVGWVPLSWGEPLIPWWGPTRSHRPWWGGWGGPRFREVERTGGYRNMNVGNGMVVVRENRFGRVPIRSARISGVDPRGFRPMPAAPIISSTHPAGPMQIERRGVRPPDAVVERPVVSTRLPRRPGGSVSPGQQYLSPTGRALPAPRIVNAPKTETVQKRIEVRQTLPTGQSPQIPSRQLRREQVIAPAETHEVKVQQQQQEIQQQRVRQQQIQEQQVHQQQIQQQQIQQQQIREQQVHQQQIQQQQIQQQQIREQQVHQQQIQQQQIQQQQIQQQQIHQQQIREQQVHQQQVQQQQIQQQQQVQQQQVRGQAPRTTVRKGDEPQGEEQKQVIIRTQ